MEKEIYCIWLSLIPKLGYRQILDLKNEYKSYENIWKETKKENLIKFSGIGEKKAEAILSYELKKEAILEWEEAKKRKIKVLGILEENYPELLKQIYDPPICLYALGNISCLKKNSLAIVGSRNASDYGKKVAYFLAYQLSKKRICIVSGLASGIDSYSHNGAICAYDEKDEDMGKTIAVVGTGLDQIYPKENRKLQEKILSFGGVILSEYRIGTKLNKYHFPERNRIISGLSLRNNCSRSRRKKWFFNYSRFRIRARKRSFCSSRTDYSSTCKRNK